MANEAYRAVFLRVHPTGKMVLSLTTESDGEEARYAQLVAGELGVPTLDVKVVPADTDRFGAGHGYNTAPSQRTPAAIESATGKILDKAGCSPPPRSTARPKRSSGTTARSSRATTQRRRRRLPTSRSTPTAPACCPRASRVGSTRRLSTRISEPWRRFRRERRRRA
jgi:CO/xanthine dehydrogenase Mo-binding subunit